MTALCRLIVHIPKEADPWMLIAEAGAIAVLAAPGICNELERQIKFRKTKTSGGT